MSTKQTVIFTFMILFLGVMLFAMGSWFYWSVEYSKRSRMIEVLGDQKIKLTQQLGTQNVPGLDQLIDDPVKGLKRQLEESRNAAVTMKGNEAGGAMRSEILYNEKENELTQKWPVAKDKWTQLYTDWRELNKKIDGSMLTLARQKSDKDKAVESAKVDLTAQLETEDTERKKAIVDRKKMNEEIRDIRFSHEEVQDKISSVTREVTKSTKITPQGRIIYAAVDQQTVDIDLGSVDGIRKDLEFDVYSRQHVSLVKKGTIRVLEVKPSSAHCLILPPKRPVLMDPQTGWIAPDARMKYSIWSASGADESDAQELITPKSKAERVAQYQQEKLEKEMSLEQLEEYRRQKEAPTTPPVHISNAFSPLSEGDWIFNGDFVPIVSAPRYQKQMVDEIMGMRNVNVGALTFYFSDTVRPYRKEFLKRLCERNNCKVSAEMSPDVNYVVASAGSTVAELLKEKLEGSKDKGDEVPAEIKAMRSTLAALDEARKIGAEAIPDDEMEAFFTRRARKQELLRGRTVQPGQSTFFIAGETRDRSVDHLTRYIQDHGGVVAKELDASVDYVVVGAGLDQKFFDERIKKLGLKIIREDELPRYFGVGK